MSIMGALVNIIKAIYTFIVGDMIILIGVLVLVAILAALEHFDTTPQHILSGVILIIGLLAILIATLSREAYSKKR